MPRPCAAFTLLGFLIATACSSMPRIASSVPIAANSTRTLSIECELPHEVAVQLWNRGPGEVSYRTADGSLQGTMAAGSGDSDWQMHGKSLVIELRCGDRPATVGYTVRSNGSMQVKVGP